MGYSSVCATGAKIILIYVHDACRSRPISWYKLGAPLFGRRHGQLGQSGIASIDHPALHYSIYYIDYFRLDQS